MRIGAVPRAAPFLERQTELRTFEETFAATCAGSGGIVLIEGQTGRGKTRLLSEAATIATHAGMTVLRGRGDEHERQFPFGVALQLFEGPLNRTSRTDRRQLLSGTASVVRSLFEGEARAPEERSADETLRLIHGLFWMAQSLAERRALALFVDDAHWADAASLRFLLYVANRNADTHIAVVAAYRSLGELRDTPLVSVAALPHTRVIPLRELSEQAVTAFVREHLPGASDAFCRACVEATGGNPFFVREVLHTVAAERIPPTDEGVDQIRGLVPEAVSRSILLRLSRLPAGAAALAQAVAVLGETTLADAAAVARLHVDRARELADALVASDVLATGDPLGYSHPVVRATVYEDTPRARRGRMELDAARIRLAAGAPPERVAAHLLAAPPAHEVWVIEPLRRAAAQALSRGAPHSAVSYLRRASMELRPSPELLVELGWAETAAGDPEAIGRLDAALALVHDPLVRARVHLMRGRTLSAQGRFADAAAAFQEGVAEARGLDPDLSVELEAGFLGVARLEPALHAAAAERIERLVQQPPEGDLPAIRPLLADVALTRGYGGAPVETVRPLAIRGWADGALLAEQGPDAMSIYLLTAALTSIDELAMELEVLDATILAARQRGSVMAVATASYCRAWPFYLLARIPEALADVELAVRAERDGWEMFVPPLHGFWALCLVARGDLGAVERSLELPDRDRWVGSLPYAVYLDARAQVRLAQRRPHEALTDATESGRLLEEVYGGTGRGFVQWRCTVALAAAAVGQRDRAARLCKEELEIARAGDRNREIGTALRTMAVLEHGEARLRLLHQAVERHEHSQATLELLRTRVELGAALRRAGRRAAARGPLRAALETASARGATALAVQAREELLAAGARPRRTAVTGLEALTPSELRVARLASEGLPNRSIAEALFVTPKTVDFHLRNVYQKLEVTRARLASVLNQGEPAARD